MTGQNDVPQIARAGKSPTLPLSEREAAQFEKLLSLYSANCRGTHGLAENTIKNYRGCVTRAVREIGRPPWAWRPRDIDRLLSRQYERGTSPGWQSQTIAALRGFQNYVLRDIGLCNELQQEFDLRPQEFITEENSVPYRRRGRQRSRPIKTLSPEQCAALLDEYRYRIAIARKQHSKSYKVLRRDYAMAVTALSYGIRADEIAGIEVGHFLADRKYPHFGRFAVLRVIGKGRKERAVRLYAPGAAKVLKWYVEHVRAAFLTKRTSNPDLLFLSERGGRLCQRQFRKSLRKTAVLAGLPMRVYPHLLRHTYATEMAPIIGPTALQQQLGHTHLSTTLGTYYHQDPERVGHEVALGIEAMTAAFDEITKEASHENHS